MDHHFVILRYSAAVIFFTLIQTFYSFNFKDFGRKNGYIPGRSLSNGPDTSGSAHKLYCGVSHTLAIKSDSTLWAWGNNSQGQLGNGNAGPSWYPVQVNGMAGVTGAAGGFGHSLAVKNNGTVWAWGRNAEGELGDGTTAQRITPVEISGLSSVKNVGCGYYHSFAIKNDGSLWAWGKNNYGQLGDSSILNHSTPTQVISIFNVIDAAGGEEFSVALRRDSTIWTWGRNTLGQLGDGTNTQRKKPVQVSGGLKAIAISCGKYHSLALKADGTVWAWGNNPLGQLGNGNTLNQRIPVRVNGLTDVISVAAGERHSLAVKSDGTIWAWGNNAQGQLGIGTTDENPHEIPVQTGRVTSGITVRAGTHSLVIKSDKSVWAWGNNANGQYGNGLNINSYWPQPSLFTFTLLSLINRPTFKPDGGAYTTLQKVTVSCSTPGVTIRYTTNGADPTKNDPVITSGSKVNIPKGITSLKATAFKTGLLPGNVKAAVYQVGERVISGYSHSLAIRSDSILWAWGNNNSGQLGISSVSQQVIPIQVNLPGVVKDAAGGFEHTLILKSDGTVWSFGRNAEGQLGDGTTTRRTTPVQVSGPGDVENVAAGYYHSMAVKADGSLWTWGKNNAGQLGTGDIINRSTPVKIDTLSGVIDVAAGAEFSVALKDDGTVWTWGKNIEGQLGDGTNSQHSSPVQVSNGSNVIAISAGRSHALALKADGTVWGWGANLNGQLGNGTLSGLGEKIPVQVSGMNDVVAIAAGEKHSLAVKRDGTIWAWGFNLSGQLGDLTHNNSRKSPVQVPQLSNVFSLSAGTQTLFITYAYGVHLFWANGFNSSGQLGDSTRILKNFRTLVHFPLDENGNGSPESQDYQYLDAAYADMDRDGLLDWKEVILFGTDPHNFDTNGDGLSDGANVLVGLKPTATDTDKDGISNTQEINNGTSAVFADTDGDGIPDKLDDFPLDRLRTKKPPADSTDHTVPVIILEEPK